MQTATVAICTHDRAASLPRAAERALGEARACGAEVLIVDNASTDSTPDLLAALTRDAAPTLRAVQEPCLGLSAARNRALAEASAEVVAFLDDDAVPRPGWLAALLGPFSAGAACVGGRIVLRYPAARPAWLTPALEVTLGAHDLGPGGGYSPGEHPRGGNVAFRVATARALGGFSTRMGLRGRHQLQHEETDLCARIARAGGTIAYAHDAVVEHTVFPERLTPQWFLERQWQHGQSAAIYELRNHGLRRALGWLRWHHRPNLGVARYVPREPIDPVRLLAEVRRREALGYLVGLLRGIPRLPSLRRDACVPAGSQRA